MNNPILSQAKILLNRGDFKEALQLYQKLITSDPMNALAYQNASIVLGELERHNDALEMSIKALEIDPNLVIPHVTMAYIFDTLGNKGKSREEAKIALAKDPESPEALCCLGILSLIDNKLDDAALYLEKAVKVNPSFYLAHYNLAAIYQSKKDSRKLLRQAVTLCRIKPNIKSLFRLMFLLSRAYKLVYFPILLLSAFLALILGAKIILIVAFLLTLVWFAGGVYIGLLAEKKQLKQLLFNIAGGIGVAILGLVLYFSMNYFFER